MCTCVLFLTSVTGIGDMNGIVFAMFGGVGLLYSFPGHFSKKINYTDSPYIHIINKQFSDISILSKYYSFLSPYTSIKITQGNIFCAFSVIFYIPLLSTMIFAIYLQVKKIEKDVNVNYILLLTLPHAVIVLSYAKYFVSLIVAYIVSGYYMIINDELIFKGNIIHSMSSLAFILLNSLFAIMLRYDHEKNTKDVNWVIAIHVILNFFFFIEMCKFFKYDHGKKEEIFHNKYSRDGFLCKYENEENEGDPDYEEYYLLGRNKCNGENGSKIVSWYFGKGFTGRMRILFTYLIVPLISQLLGFLYYVFYQNSMMYITIVCLSYSIWVLQTFVKFIVFNILCFLRNMMYAMYIYCLELCTVTLVGEVSDDNIEPV